MAERVILGLGANVGDPARQLAEAVEAVGRVVDVDAVSSLYRSEPVGDANQPDFLNLVVAGRTGLEPEALLEALLAIEARMGRIRTARNAPRIIDIDLLAYGDRVMESPALALPHPRLHLRGFVLHPLAEIAPGWKHPLSRKTARELLSLAPALERVERAGPLPRAGEQAEPPLAPERRSG